MAEMSLSKVENYLVGARRKNFLAGLKTVDSIDCVNVELIIMG